MKISKYHQETDELSLLKTCPAPKFVISAFLGHTVEAIAITVLKKADVGVAMTMTFICLVLIQFFKAYNFRSDRNSVFNLPFANR
jgi:hypothetical protein